MTTTLARNPGRTLRRSLAIAAGALALVLGGGAQAQGHGFHGGYHGGGYHGGGWHGGGYRGWGWDPLLGIGLGLGIGYIASAPLYYDQPNYVVVNPPVYYPPQPVYTSPATVPAPAPAEPIFYPRSGQGAAQTEADRQACNRWATTQPNAMNDASVFQRATLACMDGRGYTAR